MFDLDGCRFEACAAFLNAFCLPLFLHAQSLEILVCHICQLSVPYPRRSDIGADSCHCVILCQSLFRTVTGMTTCHRHDISRKFIHCLTLLLPLSLPSGRIHCNRVFVQLSSTIECRLRSSQNLPRCICVCKVCFPDQPLDCRIHQRPMQLDHIFRKPISTIFALSLSVDLASSGGKFHSDPVVLNSKDGLPNHL